MKQNQSPAQHAARKARWKVFRRSFLVSFFVLTCVTVGLLGMAQADRNTRTVGFADSKPAIAVDYHDGRLYLHFFGYEIEWDIGKPSRPRTIWIQPVGQPCTHAPQPVHFWGSTEAT